MSRDPRDPLFVFEHNKNLMRGAHDGAIFGDAPWLPKAYRFALWRMWDIRKPYINFVMLNPSIAGEVDNDPTITRCCRRARMMGYGGIVVTNAYAAIATEPASLRFLVSAGKDVIGIPKNGEHLAVWSKEAGLVLCGWGVECDKIIAGRGAEVLALLRSTGGPPPHALGFTSGGVPGHPLYLPYGIDPREVPL